jgi:HNH endonuclease
VSRRSPITNPWAMVRIVNGCWLWQGLINNHGYGMWGREPVHRRIYRRVKGPIPPKMTVHHTCEVRSCIKPGHLVLMSQRDNLMASDTPARRCVRRTRCLHGHPMDGIRTGKGRIYRYCKTCSRERWRQKHPDAVRRVAVAEHPKMTPRERARCLSRPRACAGGVGCRVARERAHIEDRRVKGFAQKGIHADGGA